MIREACRFAFDCLNTSNWFIPTWTLIGGVVAAAIIWFLLRR